MERERCASRESVEEAKDFDEVLSRPTPPSAAQARQFIAWIRASKAHARLYMGFRAAAASDSESRMVTVSVGKEDGGSTAQPPRAWSPWPLHVVAAAGVLMLSFLSWRIVHPEKTTMHVVTGPQSRTVALPGASTMTVYGTSRVDVEHNEPHVDVHIHEGGASFEAPLTPNHRLTVHVPGGRIEPSGLERQQKASRAGREADALEFNVLRKGTLTGVFVSRGSVRIRGEHQETVVVVTAGEATNLSADGVAPDAVRVDDSVLQFDSLLGDVADLFNAHNTVPQLLVVGEARARQIGGLVHIHRPANLALALRELGEYTLETRGNEVTIRMRSTP